MSTSSYGPQFDLSQHGSPRTTSGSMLETLENFEMNQISGGSVNLPKTNSTPSRNTSTSTNTHNTFTSLSTVTGGHRALAKEVRALPSWVRSFNEDDEDTHDTNSLENYVLPLVQLHNIDYHQNSGEHSQRVSQDGYIYAVDDVPLGINERKQDTGFFGGYREPVKGRRWDHMRDGEPVIVQTRALEKILPWRAYIESSTHRPVLEDSASVDDKFLHHQTSGYQIPWRGDLKGNEDPETQSGLPYTRKQRKTIMRRVQYHLIMHPLVPLLFRLIVLSTSVIALGIATSVHHLSIKYDYDQTPSSTMAIIVDVVAIPYILYITWDEYTGKPLGLRAPGAKIRLVLLDLFFIVFESANLALAFGALTDDNGSCESSINGYNHIICSRVKALCGILMMALYAWSLTFAISIFRLVHRVGGKEEE